MFGKLLDYKVKGQEVQLYFEHKEAKIEVLSNKIIRVFAAYQGEGVNSCAIEEEKKEACHVEVAREGEALVIRTDAVMIQVWDGFFVDFYDARGRLLSKQYRGERTPLCVIPDSLRAFMEQEGHTFDIGDGRDYKIQQVRELEDGDCIYGLGDKTGVLNKRYYEYEMWNTDNPDPHEDHFKALYKSIPFFITLKKNACYGIFFDNHNKTYFDMGKESEDYYVFGSEGGNLEFYFFAGDNMKEIIAEYTSLTGRMPLPQLWTLGYHQSRWGYETEEEIRYIAENLRSHDIPCDSIHFDIDYMDGYRVFTWNKETYKDSKQALADLTAMGFKPVAIIDPGVKKEDGYYVYDEGRENGYFATDAEGNEYVNTVWPGESVFPDFGRKEVRDWWGKKHQFLLDQGVRGVWNDMNEPASFNGPLPDDVVFYDEDRRADHAEMHNVYGHNMAKATYEGLKELDKRRPFVITRACYSGSQKYAVGWTGDNQSLWTHLRLAVVQLCNCGMSGFPFIGTDIGGFGSDTTKELLTRWVQVGCFSPLFRNHCAKGRASQEPWVFDEETLRIYRKFVKLRYRLLPYLYDVCRETALTGIPMIRPLVLEYEKDENVRNLNDEFMVGDHLLVAPVLEQGQRKKLVYLPEGVWYDYWTKEQIMGGGYHIADAPLDGCPLYVKQGVILPMYQEMDYVSEKKDEVLFLEAYGANTRYVHYQDNGEDFGFEAGEYNEYEFQVEEGQLKTSMLHEGYTRYGRIELKKIY